MEMERIRLLVVDDDVCYRAQVRHAAIFTQDIDWVGEACNGVEAIERIETLLPDVVVLDSVLPGMDGIGVLQRIRMMTLERRPHVLLLTFDGQKYVEKAGYELGADDCIQKAKGIDKLFEEIRACVHRFETEIDPELLACYAQWAGKLLDRIRMGAHLNGYAYLCYGVALVCMDGTLLRGITTHIYPMIAQHFDTSSRRVERSIRHAIETTFNAGDYQAIYEIFGNTIDPQRGKPTNGEFVAQLAERVRLQVLQTH